ncbi:MAG: protein translocase subunit SecD [bacterium]
MKNVAQKMFTSGGRAKVWRTFVVLLVITLAATVINLGAEFNKGADWVKTRTGIPVPHVIVIPFHLGLDLLGGTQLTYQADVSAIPVADRTSAVEGVRDVIERRVNAFGVAEPNIQTNYSGGKPFVLVELAGVKDAEKAIKMIGETPLLEFKEKSPDARKLTKEEEAQIKKYNTEAEKKVKVVMEKIKKGENIANLTATYSDDADSKAKGGDIGWVTSDNNPTVAGIAAKLAVGKTSDAVKFTKGYEIVKLDEKKAKTDPFNNQPEREVKASHLLICFKDVEGCDSGLTKDEARSKIEKIKKEATIKNFSELVKKNSTEPGARNSGGSLGWFSAGKMVAEFEKAVFAGKKGEIIGPIETQFGYHLIYKEDERQISEFKVRHLFIKTMSATDIVGEQTDWKNTELTGKNLKSAVVTTNQVDMTPQVSLEFDEQGAKLFADVTGRNINKQVAIFLDGYSISSPTVNEKIPNGKAVINGRFSAQEAKVLAQRLNAGALPVPINLVNQQLVGATLGAKSVQDSVKAGLIGFVLVAVFMLLFYRLPGLLAVIALMIYVSFSLAIFKLGWISLITLFMINAGQVTITLAGMAGFIMSIGVAVDANILIFARMREEMANGRPFSLAIEEGFRRAWPSIRDSNSMTLLTCIILMMTTAGVVKGFAVTLFIGVVVSMFTAIFVTRTLLKLIPENILSKWSFLISSSKK